MPWLPLIVLFLLRAFDNDRPAGYLINAGVAGLALGWFLAGSLHIAIMDECGRRLKWLPVFTAPKRTSHAAAIVVAVIAAHSSRRRRSLWPSFGTARFHIGGWAMIAPFARFKDPLSGSGSNHLRASILFALFLGEVSAGKSG
jgi:hypothetical protein